MDFTTFLGKNSIQNEIIATHRKYSKILIFEIKTRRKVQRNQLQAQHPVAMDYIVTNNGHRAKKVDEESLLQIHRRVFEIKSLKTNQFFPFPVQKIGEQKVQSS